MKYQIHLTLVLSAILHFILCSGVTAGVHDACGEPDFSAAEWLPHGANAFGSDITDLQPILEGSTATGDLEFRKLDLSTLEKTREFHVVLNNATSLMYKFTLSAPRDVRFELIPDNNGPHGELAIDLYTMAGTHFYRDINNGLYRNPKWVQSKHGREVPRIELSNLPAGEFFLSICNSYVNDTGILRIGLLTQDALSVLNMHPMNNKNDLPSN